MKLNKIYKLAQICSKIGSGATPKGGKESYLGGNTSLIRSQNVIDFGFLYNGLALINDEQAHGLDNVTVMTGDVLLNITGDSVARCCKVPSNILPARVNQHVAIIRGDNNIVISDYILYYLQYKKPYLLSLSQGGATRNALTKKMIEDIKIPLPSISEQRHIIDLLSSIDNKIELNRRINDNLEQQAQALFNSWFVDFEPWGGVMPDDWKEGSIYEIVDVIYGAPYKSNLFNEKKEGLPLIRIRDLKDYSPQYYTPEILPNTEFVCMGDVIAGMDAEFIPTLWMGNKGVLNQRCCKFKSKNPKFSNYYIMYLLKPELEFVQSYKTGTTVSHLGKSDIDRFMVVIPSSDVIEDFSRKVEPLLSEKIKACKEMRILSSLRDTLLPKLMSGELKINDLNS